jgi:hypothetical protein
LLSSKKQKVGKVVTVLIQTVRINPEIWDGYKLLPANLDFKRAWNPNARYSV